MLNLTSELRQAGEAFPLQNVRELHAVLTNAYRYDLKVDRKEHLPQSVNIMAKLNELDKQGYFEDEHSKVRRLFLQLKDWDVLTCLTTSFIKLANHSRVWWMLDNVLDFLVCWFMFDTTVKKDLLQSGLLVGGILRSIRKHLGYCESTGLATKLMYLLTFYVIDDNARTRFFLMASDSDARSLFHGIKAILESCLDSKQVRRFFYEATQKAYKQRRFREYLFELRSHFREVFEHYDRARDNIKKIQSCDKPRTKKVQYEFKYEELTENALSIFNEAFEWADNWRLFLPGVVFALHQTKLACIIWNAYENLWRLADSEKELKTLEIIVDRVFNLQTRKKGTKKKEMNRNEKWDRHYLHQREEIMPCKTHHSETIATLVLPFLATPDRSSSLLSLRLEDSQDEDESTAPFDDFSSENSEVIVWPT